MKWNGPTVQFVLINVIADGSDQAKDIIALKRQLEVTNLQIVPIDISDFSKRVNSKLNISVNMTMDWYYKLCDFKPVLAYLFPELASGDLSCSLSLSLIHTLSLSLRAALSP